MIRSVFFRRMLRLIAASIVLAALLSAVLFTVASRTQVRGKQEDELFGQADLAAGLYQDYFLGRYDSATFQRMLNSSGAVAGARLHIFPASLDYVIESYSKTDTSPQLASEAARDFAMLVVTNGGRTTRTLDYGGNTFLLVGVPVRVNNGIVAAVVFSKTFVQLNADVDMLSRTLVFSMCTVILVMVLPLIFFSRRMVLPLYRMRDAAVAMARGDFSLRAEDTVPGEIGQLGHSLNYMAQRLDATITELKNERNRLKRIIDGMSDGIFAIDRSGVITHRNPALSKLGVDEFALLEDMKAASLQGIAVEKRMQAGSRIIHVEIAPIQDGAIAIAHDITESERLEQTRRDYVANVSHELRTPITTMRGIAEVLADDMVKNEEDKKRYYAHILHESVRLSALVNELLELSRIQAGTDQMELEQVDTAELLLGVEKRYRLRAEEAGITLSAQTEGDCTALLSGARLEQILIILLDNAIKFTPSGGSISLNARPEGEWLAVRVQDNGIGISPEDAEHVFERFYKADKSHSGGGTGLGLAIARELTERMGGEITVESTQGVGSVFTVRLRRE